MLAILKRIRRRAAFHSEDEARLNERKALRVAGDPSSHPVWRDEIAALRSTERLIRLARLARAQVHVLHISTREEMDFLASEKDVASCEATPHHLTLSAEDYPRLGTKMQMNPPVRGPEHRDAIWRGLEASVVDVLGSDHAPHTLEEKARPYPASPSGMTGVQTLVPIMLDHVNAGRLTLERFVDLTSAGPQRLFGIVGKGRIARRLRRRFHDRRSQAERDHPQFLDRLPLALDALRWPDGHGLADRNPHPRAPGDVGGRTHGAVDGRGGAVLVRALGSPLDGELCDIARPRLAGGARFIVEAPQYAARQRDVDACDGIIEGRWIDCHQRKDPAGKFRLGADRLE